MFVKLQYWLCLLLLLKLAEGKNLYLKDSTENTQTLPSVGDGVISSHTLTLTTYAPDSEVVTTQLEEESSWIGPIIFFTAVGLLILTCIVTIGYSPDNPIRTRKSGTIAATASSDESHSEPQLEEGVFRILLS